MPRKVPDIVKKIQNYKYPELNYSYQHSVSYSQLQTYLSCPHKWQLQYKDNLGIYDYNIHMVFGSALHEALQKYLTIMYDTSGAEADRFEINEFFKEQFFEIYNENLKRNKGTHFSSAHEMREFYKDGLEIINFIKKKRGAYFSRKGWHLVGVEIPLLIQPNDFLGNTFFKGYLDLVLYHEPSNTFKIIDIKTSTNGWNKWKKKDEKKTYQLILYKKYFSKQFNVPIEDIDVEFFIVKRKLYENVEFAQKRVQEFKPASGKNKTNKATKALSDFISECFDTSGKIKDKEHVKFSGKQCDWCVFSEKNLCNRGKC